MMSNLQIVVFFLILCFANNSVIELDSNFREIVNTHGPWLIKFYAPWCGYCKKLEPVYEELSISLKDFPIKVARLDATKFPEIASIFHIRGYPTIKFINGSTVYTHDGERTVRHLIQFTKRSLGPALRYLPSEGRFNEALDEQIMEPFYLYIGATDTYLRKVYENAANELRLYSFYYSIEKHSIPEKILQKINFEDSLDSSNGTLLIWKNRNYQINFLYKLDNISLLNSTLKDWIMKNRFPIFQQVTHNEIMQLQILHKPIVIFLLNKTHVDQIDHNIDESKYPDSIPSSIKYYKLGEKFSTSTDSLLNDFEFVWTSDGSIVSDLAMCVIPTPNLLIFYPHNMTIYLHPSYDNVNIMNKMSQQHIIQHLEEFKFGNIPGYGGTGFLAKLRRAGYDFMTGLLEFVTGAPLLAMFVIGVPLAVISFLFYAIFCMDTSEGFTSEEAYRKSLRAQKREKPPLYQVPLRSSEELNISKPVFEKKNE